MHVRCTYVEKQAPGTWTAAGCPRSLAFGDRGGTHFPARLFYSQFPIPYSLFPVLRPLPTIDCADVLLGEHASVLRNLQVRARPILKPR